jgi:hypothetical protein
MNDLVSDDALWKKKAELAAGILKTRRSLADALDLAFVQAFQQNQDIVVAFCTTSTGRPCRVVLALGEEAVQTIDDDFGVVPPTTTKE